MWKDLWKYSWDQRCTILRISSNWADKQILPQQWKPGIVDKFEDRKPTIWKKRAFWTCRRPNGKLLRSTCALNHCMGSADLRVTSVRFIDSEYGTIWCFDENNGGTQFQINLGRKAFILWIMVQFSVFNQLVIVQELVANNRLLRLGMN